MAVERINNIKCSAYTGWNRRCTNDVFCGFCDYHTNETLSINGEKVNIKDITLMDLLKRLSLSGIYGVFNGDVQYDNYYRGWIACDEKKAKPIIIRMEDINDDKYGDPYAQLIVPFRHSNQISGRIFCSELKRAGFKYKWKDEGSMNTIFVSVPMWRLLSDNGTQCVSFHE